MLISERRGQVEMHSDRDTRWHRFFASDLKLTFILWLPTFAAILWLGIQRAFPDIVLFAIAMGLVVWSVCDAAVLIVANTRKLFAKPNVGPADALHNNVGEKPDV